MLKWLIDLFINYINYLGLSLRDALLILIIPVTLDFSRTLFKTVLLPLHALYKRVKPLKGVLLSYPKVSIIVPAHNEEETIEHCILSLIEDPYPYKEIIVVDDGSTDRTYDIAYRFVLEGKIKLLKREASGRKAYAVNYGLVSATGDIVVVIDADTLIERGALEEIIKCFRLPRTGGVAGNVKVFNTKSLLGKLQAYEYLTSMEMGRRLYGLIGTILIIPGAFGAVKRKIMRGVGSFDADTITEDFDLTLKIHKTRFKVRFAPEAIAYTFVPESFKAWVKQRVRWAHGQVETLKKHFNMVFKPFFGVPGIVGTPSMIFFDFILTLVKIAWFTYLLLFYWKFLLNVYALIFPFYLFNELALGLTSIAITPKRGEIKLLALLPVFVFIYRPIYGLVRLKGYLEGFLGKKTKW